MLRAPLILLAFFPFLVLHATHDPGLQEGNVRSIGEPGSENFVQQKRSASTEHWTLAIQSGQCDVPTNQSLPINSSGPVSMRWVPNGDGFSVNLKYDDFKATHPCGRRVWTNVALKDQPTGQRSLGPLVGSELHGRYWYNDWVVHGAARVFVGASAWWKPYGGQSRQHIISVQDSTNWGDAIPNSPAVVTHFDGDFIAVDGPRAFGLRLGRGEARHLTWDIERAFRWAVEQGFWRRPVDWDQVKIASVFVGVETWSLQSEDSVVANLWISELEIRRNHDR